MKQFAAYLQSNKHFSAVTSVLLLLLTTYYLLPTAFAAANNFTVGLNVVSDLIPPSTPAGLTSNAVSASQIDLSWTASTDNVAVSGYVIRRGLTPVASTSATTYSDTGLTASTPYSYTVQAFDTTFNYSGLSSTSSATTSASGGGGGGGGGSPPVITAFSPASGASGVSPTTTLTMTMSQLVNKVSGNITIKKYTDNSVVDTITVGSAQVVVSGAQVTITLSASLGQNTQYYVEAAAGTFANQTGQNFAGFSGNSTWVFTTSDTIPPIISGVSATSTYTSGTVTFTTSENALATLDWGTSTTYALGSASEVGYGTAHSITLTGLATSTLYYFRITAKDTSSNVSTPSTGNFSTQNPPPPPDTTPPANPGAFTANPGLNNIALTWTNPSDPDFSAVRIMRKTSGYPADPSDGVLVYDGSAQSINDTSLATGTRYYYTAFARDTLFNYSSGAIVTAVTSSGVPPPPPPTPSPTPNPGGSTPPPPPPGSGTTPVPEPPIVIFPPITSTSTGPFVDFTGTGTPSVITAKLRLEDLIFTQLGDKETKLTIKNGTVRTNGDLSVRVSLPSDKLPDSLTTIAISIEDPKGKNSAASFLLRINEAKSAFEGVVPAFGSPGMYTFTVSVLDHERQAITRVPGVFEAFIIPRFPSIIPEALQQAVNQALTSIEAPVNIVSPVAAPIGVAVGASQAVLLATNVGSGYDLYLLFLKLIGLLTGLFRRKRNEPWGVVYDSITKRPLDPAYVIAAHRETSQSKGEAITDLDGRYGFFLNPGEYVIVANKTHYKFPSDKLKGKSRDELYENLYFGDPFQVREGGVVQYNIPLDPIEFDWNEFAKNQDQVFQIYSKKKNIRLWVFNTIFYVGLIFSLLSLALAHTLLNFIVVAIYLIIFSFQVFWHASHKVTRILNKETGKPMPFALIKVWLPGLNTIVKKSVSDIAGRYFFLIPPGTYYLTVEEKLPDGSYKEVLHTPDMELKGGVVKQDLLV